MACHEPSTGTRGNVVGGAAIEVLVVETTVVEELLLVSSLTVAPFCRAKFDPLVHPAAMRATSKTIFAILARITRRE